jgi:antitoxin VapB
VRNPSRSSLCRMLTPSWYIPYIPPMNATAKTSAFKSGNSVAVRLPKSFGVRPGDQFELVQHGRMLELRPIIDHEFERAELAELARELHAIGPIAGDREDGRIEFPDRPGLY